MSLAVELKDVWTIFVGDVERAIGSDANAFRIEPVIESARRSDKTLPTLIFEKACIEQDRADVWKCRADVRGDVQEIKAIEVWNVG